MSSSLRRPRSTGSKYKGGAHHDMFVVYDLKPRTRTGTSALYPKVKRVHIAGNVEKVTKGRMRKRSGRQVRGVRIEYVHTRKGYRREPFLEYWNIEPHLVEPRAVRPAQQRFIQMVELPERAHNVRFYPSREQLPEKYAHALQRVR